MPPNTVIRSSDGAVIGFVQEEGDYFIAARGGQGGKGNHFFATLPKRVLIQHEIGANGQTNLVYLSSAMKADVGLVSKTMNNITIMYFLRAV